MTPPPGFRYIQKIFRDNAARLLGLP